ncbi:MAG: hydroxyphenylacetyl-CoA thioesterase PaaI [Actinomycetota bacterium]|nr:hydroxyphenylacetyl-CoA thioesterase PaaI [Actinomycetota bacterium]
MDDPLDAPLPAGAAGPEMRWADGAGRLLGITVRELGDGRALATMLVRPDMVNQHGVAHGAMVFALADSAFACACNSRGILTVAAGADITFVTAAHVGDRLVAKATERTSFGRHGIYDVTVSREGTVVAEFRGRSTAPRRWG